jgi:hypothetical protein
MAGWLGLCRVGAENCISAPLGEPDVRASHSACMGPVARRRLDLDDVGAEIGELNATHFRSSGPREMEREIFSLALL